MNTNVYIIRHAEVEYPYDQLGRRLMYRPETHISIEGKEQLKKFATLLKDKDVVLDSIETSPYIRAVESAQIVSQILGNPEVIENTAFVDSHIPGWFDIP